MNTPTGYSTHVLTWPRDVPGASLTAAVLDGDFTHDADSFSNEDHHGVLTHVGGMSLFLELCLDSADDNFGERSFKEMARHEELVGTLRTHVGSVSLFRGLMLVATQPCCGRVLISGFKEQLHMMKNDDELCEQWDPGILVEKTFILAVHDVNRTKRLFLDSKFLILEAIGSERPAPWPSWRYHCCGELLGFQSTSSIHALGCVPHGKWVAPCPLCWSWFICYLTRVRLKQPTAERKNLSKEQLVDVLCSIIFHCITIESVHYPSVNVLELFSCNVWSILGIQTCRHDLDKAEIACSICGLALPQGVVVRSLPFGVWLLSYHGILVHIDCQLSRALKYKIRTVQQKHGGIDINHGCKDFTCLLGWMDVGVINTCWLHLIVSWKSPQLILLCCVDSDTTYTGEPRGVVNMEAKYSLHTRSTIVLVLDHDQNAAVFVVIPELILSLQGQHGLVLLIDLEYQAV